jgi:F-type H+-transporting ATPase subunit delta
MNDRELLYSSSLYSAAVEENASKEVYDSLQLVASVISDSPEYIRIINSVSLPLETRENLIDEAFSGNVHVFVLNFLKLLAKRRIANIFLPCVKNYEKLYFKDNNIERATITTAIELAEDKKREIVEKIEASSGKKVIPSFIVSPDIVGGIVIETESSAIDASVKTKLESIRRYISKN